jgi:hypothetical protein
MTEHLCVGPEGDNLLGFLASVGALVTLDRMWQDGHVRLYWKKMVRWHPVIQVEVEATEDEMLDVLYDELKKRKINITDEDGNLAENTNKITLTAFRRQAESCVQQATVKERFDADFMAAIAGEALSKEDYVADTAFRTQSGVGHQNFLGIMRNLIEKTTKEDLRDALFSRWRYVKARNMSLRYDPIEDRRYAYRASNPEGELPVTMPGANRLAIEALVCFPTFPSGGKLLTTCFKEKYVRWPIWERPITACTLRSLLLRKELYQPEMLDSLEAIGVPVIYFSARISTGGDRYRNFTPAGVLV